MLSRTLHIALLFYLGMACALAQQPPQDATIDGSTVTIGSIYITGNEKTREEIIVRELGFEKGDVLKKSDLLEILELDRQKIINTRLFITVEVIPLLISDSEVDILIKLQERWYIFPVPIFKLADRNFTEWWVNQNRDFSRVNWGAQLFHMNLTGRNDRLSARLQFGFTKLYALQYSLPYIDKNQKLGISFSASYATNKTVGLSTNGHRQEFISFEDETLRKNINANVGFTYRPTFYTRHTFDLGYSNTKVQDTVAIANPNYLGDANTRLQYLRLSYVFSRDLRDFVAYPLTGSYFRVAANQFGLGVFKEINMLTTRATYSKFFDLGKDFFQANRLEVFKNWADNIPYVRRTGFGYRPDFIRGYEKYVIETDFLISYRTSLKWQFLEGVSNLNERSVIPQFRTLPYAFYFKVFMDVGYAGDPLQNNENNFWNNDMVGSLGVGIDIVTYYDFVMRFEYSVNREGGTGFYFNLRGAL